MQSIKEVDVEFNEQGLHWLRGGNDVGKSALQRAIIALLTNVSNMKYKDYIRDNCNYFTVCGYFGGVGEFDSNTDYVKLSRGSQDYYEWRIAGVYGREDKTNGKVPLTLQTYFGLYYEAEKTKRYLNITTSTDQLLFVETTGGDNYFLLQKALGTENISEALKVAQGKKKEANNLIKFNQNYYDKEAEELEVHRQKLVDISDSLEYLERFEKVLETEKAELDFLREMIDSTNTYVPLALQVRSERLLLKELETEDVSEEIDDLSIIDETLKFYKELLSLEQQASVLTTLTMEELEDLELLLGQLELIESVKLLNKDVEDLERKLNSYDVYDEGIFLEVEDDLELLTLMSNCQEVNTKVNELENKKANITLVEDEELINLEKAQDIYAELKVMKSVAKDYIVKNKEYKQQKALVSESDSDLESVMNELGVCPLCGNAFSNHVH
jgi:hypothetical protein